MSSELETLFARGFSLLAPEAPAPVREYTFAPPRRWRFDFAWPEARVAVEVEGGTWDRGRHTRGAGYAGDCAKYNAAVLGGWRVLRFTSDMLYSDLRACVAQVVALLDGEQRY